MQALTSNNLKRFGLTAAFVVLGSATRAQAAVSVNETPNPLQDIPSVDDYQTTGEDMAGMEVTAFFSDGSSESVIWGATGAGSGAAVGTNWSLAESGDTFTSPWILTYEFNDGILLTGFSIDGFAAGPNEVGVMFDRTFNGDFGTPDSFKGRDFELLAPVPFDVLVTYQGAVGVGGSAPVGDEFRWLNVRFANLGFQDEFTSDPPTPSGLDGENMRVIEFFQDSNNPIVPEPGSVALLTAGGLMLLRRRRS